MLTLAIDCSSRFCSAALYRGDVDRVLAAASPDIGRGHAEQLPAIVQSVLATGDVELAAIDRVGVTVGPGSFAGIRVGVAFARGLSLALGVPSVGVGSLEAMAIPVARRNGKPVMAALDARRDRVWAILVDADGKISLPSAELTPEAAAVLAKSQDCEIIGSGAAVLAGLDPSLASRVIADLAAPKIADVARLATMLDPAENPAEPRYLRDADAKPQAGFVLPHKA